MIEHDSVVHEGFLPIIDHILPARFGVVFCTVIVPRGPILPRVEIGGIRFRDWNPEEQVSPSFQTLRELTQFNKSVKIW